MAHLPIFAKEFECHLFSYNTKTGSIADLASQFASFIKNNSSPSDEIYFLCHSLGSIITLKSFEVLSDRKIIRAVFLGPPLQGSTVAQKLQVFKFFKWYFGEPFLELAKRSPLKINLNQEFLPQIGVIAGVLSKRFSFSPWFSKPNDFLVAVDETKADGIHSHLEVRCHHTVMMYAPKIIKESFYFLRHGRFTS